MGVIQRQSIKQSLVNYIGVAFAAISTIFIYPQDTETYGLARFVIDTSLMIAPFIMLGFNAVTIRFFPDFRDEKKGHRGFLFFLVLFILIGSLLFVLLAFLFQDQLYNIYLEKPENFRRFLHYMVPLAILMAFFHLFYNFCLNFKRIVIPSIFQSLIKFSLPVLILLYLWEYISLKSIIDGIVVNYVVALLAIIAYVYWLGELKLKPDFTAFTKPKLSEIRTFAFYSLFSSVGSVLAFRIDLFMVPTLLDFKENGIYAIALFIGNAIAIPTNAIGQVASPIIANSIKDGDLAHVKEIYKSSSINLLIVGFLMFACIVASVEDLFSIMPQNKDLQDGLVVVFLIGLAKVIDMGTSLNNQIINYSKYYRFGFVAILLMAIMNISLNSILIPEYKIIGAAIATLISLSVYNLIKLIFIQWRFKMQPFSTKTIWIILIAGIAYIAGAFIPSTGIAVLDIIIKSMIIIGIYISLVLYFSISVEFQNLLKKGLDKIKGLN